MLPWSLNILHAPSSSTQLSEAESTLAHSPCQILDDTDTIRRFWFSTYTDTRVTTYLTRVPLQLARGWHIVQVNLAEFTEKTYGTTYLETLRVQVHGNCRLHQIFFSDYNNV
uniref:CFA20 domain-containing protein n=1 Tax=Graphocephala atropunctata TaxID=36148 RepID=A0A1B6L2L5_9HEMI